MVIHNRYICARTDHPVPGERVVSPSSIVNLNVRLRYVYPTTSSSKPAKALPNGDHIKSESNGDAKPDLTEKIEGASTDVNAKDEKADSHPFSWPAAKA